jgi:hypothetical protein
MAFKKDLLALLDECEHGKIYGKLHHLYTNSYLPICTSVHIWFNIYQFIKLYLLSIQNNIHHFIQSELICEMTYVSSLNVIQIHEFTYVNSYNNGLEFVNCHMSIYTCQITQTINLYEFT